jgi:hypothetical protein
MNVAHTLTPCERALYSPDRDAIPISLEFYEKITRPLANSYIGQIE